MPRDRGFWLLLIALGALLAVGGKKVYDMTRGLRNNNPGNIRLSSVTWSGQVAPESQTDPDFVQFIDPTFGIRAMARILNSYANRGITTLRGIVSTWAPPSENDTNAYLAALVESTGRDPDLTITSADYPAVIAGIIQHENGIQPYDQSVIAKGIALA